LDRVEQAGGQNGARRLIEILKRQGVDHIFGIPGVHTLPLFDALYDEPAIRTVVTRHENGASCAADGFARVRRRAAVCTAVPGPGATNLATGVLAAAGDCTPLVVITSQIPRRLRGRASIHDCDLETLYRPLVKACLVVEEPYELEPALDEAFRLAESGRPGPVQVLLSIEAFGAIEQSAGAEVSSSAKSEPGPIVSQATLAEAARLLNSAERPIIVAGDGVMDGRAEELLRAVAERLQALVFTSATGRGALPESHPQSFGLLTWDGSRDLLGAADVGLALATRFSEISTLAWSLPMPAALIRVDLEPSELSANYPPQLGIQADVRQFLEGLLPLLQDGRASVARGAALSRLAELKAARQAELATVAGSAPLHPLFVVRELRRCLPDETIFTTDGTATEFWLSEPALELNQPRTLLLPEVSQTMGWGLAAAIGARLAAPERPVVCVTGDGSLTMSLGELLTAVGLGVNLPVIIFDDGLYNALCIYQDGLYGGRRMGTVLNNPDFVKLAEALGAQSARVERPEQLGPALEAARRAPGVTLVDVAIDPRPLPSRYRSRLRQMTDLGKY
jgi:thiamine pyrophosphate-dependent acetolactate synthase large subunit-like protein